MIDLELKDLWTPAGVLLGFEVTLFMWRIEREAQIGDEGDIPWLAPADYVGIAGMIVFVFGVFLFPLSGIGGTYAARIALGVGALLFVGQSLGLCGHYQLFNRSKLRRFLWFPMQERVVIIATLVVAVGYVVRAAIYRP